MHRACSSFQKIICTFISTWRVPISVIPELPHACSCLRCTEKYSGHCVDEMIRSCCPVRAYLILHVLYINTFKFALLVKARRRDYPLKLVNLLSAVGTGVKYSPVFMRESGICVFALCNGRILHLPGLYELEVMLNSHWRIFFFFPSSKPAFASSYIGGFYFLLFLR